MSRAGGPPSPWERVDHGAVLILEDDRTSAALLASVVRSVTTRPVITVGDLSAARAHLRSTPLDLLLLDLHLPDGDATSLLAQLDELPIHGPLPPVLMITGDVSRDRALELLRLGALDVLHKPIDTAEAGAKIVNALRIHERALAATHQHEDAYRSTVRLLERITEALGVEPHGHAARVAALSANLARRLGWSATDSAMLQAAATLHDIGKLAVPPEVLQHPGPLDADGWASVRRHPGVGRQILDATDHPLVEMARAIAEYHHERWDGTGYPHGLRGVAIPEVARIVAVADVYDALMSKRVYKPAWSLQDTLDAIRSDRGVAFDPRVVDVLMDAVVASGLTTAAYPAAAD